MKTNDIKAGMAILTNQLGPLVTGVMKDNMRGDIRMIETHCSEIGLFDELGSVYAFNIIKVKPDTNTDEWLFVEHTPAQLKLKETVSRL